MKSKLLITTIALFALISPLNSAFAQSIATTTTPLRYATTTCIHYAGDRSSPFSGFQSISDEVPMYNGNFGISGYSSYNRANNTADPVGQWQDDAGNPQYPYPYKSVCVQESRPEMYYHDYMMFGLLILFFLMIQTLGFFFAPMFNSKFGKVK